MTTRQTLHRALRSFLVLKKERRDPLWARVVVGGALVLGIALVLMTVSVFLMAVPEAGWWSSSLVNNLVLGLGVGVTMLLVLRLCERVLPARTLALLAARQDWRSVAAVTAILIIGMALGTRVAYVILSRIYDFDMWKKLSGVPMVQLKFGMFALLVIGANWIWWLLQAKENALAKQAAESQLRMLQAQIEPHFLFNTLANVQSLIGSDGVRAQLMLEAFTDYLRASLGQMRVTDVPLAVELETARCYLQLMQIRMGRRLAFSIEASEEAAQAMLPPLLLQPLVENAVHHGLEAKMGGGNVRLRALVHGGQLQVTVDDDGIGLEQARRAARPGQGTALANIRERLHTRYPGMATLQIDALEYGTRATLALPWHAVQAQAR